jgi:hypothetical protein
VSHAAMINNMGGISLGFRAGSYHCHFEIKEGIYRNVADSPADYAAIKSYLKTKYGL